MAQSKSRQLVALNSNRSINYEHQLPVLPIQVFIPDLSIIMNTGVVDIVKIKNNGDNTVDYVCKSDSRLFKKNPIATCQSASQAMGRKHNIDKRSS